MLVLDAFRLIRRIKEKPISSSKLKMEHFAQIGVIEVFLEATPSTFLFCVLLVSSLSVQEEGLRVLLLGSSDVQLALFLLSFGSSIFSSAFGVAR